MGRQVQELKDSNLEFADENNHLKEQLRDVSAELHQKRNQEELLNEQAHELEELRIKCQQYEEDRASQDDDDKDQHIKELQEALQDHQENDGEINNIINEFKEELEEAEAKHAQESAEFTEQITYLQHQLQHVTQKNQQL